MRKMVCGVGLIKLKIVMAMLAIK